MIRRFAVLVLGVAAGTLGPRLAAQPRAAHPLFRVGEKLLYEVRWGFVALGTAEMQVVGIDTIRGEAAAHVQIRIRGSNYLYRMDNRMDSWIALRDTTSRRFTQDNNENGKQRHAWYDIFPDSGYYREKGVDSLRPTVKQPLDDASFFYYLRTLVLEPGKRYDIARYFRPDRNPVTIDTISIDTLDVPAGKFPSLVFQPIIKGGGILKETSEARMWLSNDDRRIMVQLKSKFPLVGYLTMRLYKIEGPAPSKK